MTDSFPFIALSLGGAHGIAGYIAPPMDCRCCYLCGNCGFHLLVAAAKRRLKARLGHLTGDYMALTQTARPAGVLVEHVRARHVGETISGMIHGIGVIDAKAEVPSRMVAQNDGCYRFAGFVSEALLVVSYGSMVPGQHDAGSIVLLGHGPATPFIGKWAGVASNEVESRTCLWWRLKERARLKRDRERLLDLAQWVVCAGCFDATPRLKGISELMPNPLYADDTGPGSIQYSISQEDTREIRTVPRRNLLTREFKRLSKGRRLC